MTKPLRVVIVEDNSTDADLILRQLRRAGFDPQWTRVETEEEFLAALNPAPELILSDYSLPHFDGLRAVTLLRERGSDVPFILISGTLGEEAAVAAMKQGADDYLLKDRLARLGAAVARGLEEKRLRDERRRIEAELRASENRYRRLFEAAHDGILIVDAETGQIDDVNPYLLNLLSYSKDQVLQKKLWELGCFRHLIANWDKFTELQREKFVRYEGLPLEAADGRSIPVEFVSNVYEVSGTKVIQCNIRDISERTRAARALQESEERLRVVTDNARVGLVVVNADHRYTFANAAYAEIFGLADSAIVGHPVSDVLSGLYEEQIRPRLQRAFAGERVSYELHRPNLSSKHFYMVNYEPVKTGEQVSHVIVVVMDITERKKHEDTVRQSEHFLSGMSNVIPGRVAHWTRELRLDFANQQYLAWAGRPLDQLMGASMREVIGEDLFRLNEPYVRAALTGQSQQFERFLTASEGPWGDIWVHYIPDWVEGRVEGLFVLISDITPLKNVERELITSLHEKDALLKEVHHRVKNNLQVIASLLRLESSRSAEPGTKTVLKDMQSRIRSMALLHESLYRSGTFAAVDLGAYLRQLGTQSFRSLVAHPGLVQLRLELDSAYVEMDQALPCGLIVNELISNSLKHGFPDGHRGEVLVELRRVAENTQLQIRVSDTGIGLPADFPTLRGRSLGLQLVSDLTQQIRGTLEIGAGSVASFTITFKAQIGTKARE